MIVNKQLVKVKHMLKDLKKHALEGSDYNRGAYFGAVAATQILTGINIEKVNLDDLVGSNTEIEVF